MRHIFATIALFIMGCGWGEVPLHSQYDADIDDSSLDEVERSIFLVENESVSSFDFLEDNNYVGLTSVCSEDSFAR